MKAAASGLPDGAQSAGFGSRTPRIGIDLGGTKIEGVVLLRDGSEAARRRVPTPRDDYTATLDAVHDMVVALRSETAGLGGAEYARAATVGIGIPGSISPATGRVQNANSTWLNGRPFREDLTERLGSAVRIANDANCFALSEGVDGAAAGARSVFGVILGTGCGGGVVVDGRLMDGPRGIGGEWGHTPLPWAEAEEHPGPACWCGRRGCMETWVSGPALAADHARVAGLDGSGLPDAAEIARRAAAGDGAAGATLARHLSRLARGLAAVVNILDPEVIVLGGGLSRLAHLYAELPRAMAPHVFADATAVDIRAPRWGDASGVRGAARLWD